MEISYHNDFIINEETMPVISQLAESIPGGFFIYHADGDQELIYFNSRLPSIFGCDNGEEFRKLVGNSFRGIVHPDDYAENESSILKQVESSEHAIDHVRYRFIRKDGSVGMMDDYGHFRHSDSFGDIFYVFVQDITEQYRAELEREETIDRIMVLEDRFECLYDVDLVTGDYSTYVKGSSYLEDVSSRLYEKREFFSDSARNSELVVYSEDRESFVGVINREFLKKALAEAPYYDYYYRLLSDAGPVWYRLRAAYKNSAKSNVIIGVFNAENEMAEKLRAEQERKDIIASISGCESAYIVDPVNDSFTVIVQNAYLENNYPEEETYTQSITRYISSDVFEPDRKDALGGLGLQNLTERLKNENEYLCRFRDISGEIPRWYEVRALKLSPAELLISFTDKDNETIEQMLFEKLRENYFGLYYINLDTGHVQIMKTGHPDITGKAGTTADYRSVIRNIGSHAVGETRVFFDRISDTGYLRSCFADEELEYYTYKSFVFEGDRWVNVTGLVLSRHEDGTPAVVALAFSLLDDDETKRREAQEELKNSMQVIGGMASEYTALYHVNLDTDDYITYHLEGRTEDIRPYYEKNPKFVYLAQGFANSELVYPDDRDVLRDFYRSAEDVKYELKDKKRISALFRRNYGGEFLWTEVAIVKCEDEQEEAHNIIVGFVEKDEEVRERAEYFLKEEETNRLIDNISSRHNLAYKVNLTDDSMYVIRKDINTLGQEKNFKCFSEVREYFINEVVHPADKVRMVLELDYGNIRRKLTEEKTYSVEYRALVNGVTLWNEMAVTQISHDEVAIGFVINDLEIISRHIEEKRFEEYLAMFVVDLDTEMIKPVKTSPLFATAAVGEAVPYEAAMKQFASIYTGETREFFIHVSDPDTIRRDLAREDKRSFSYRSSVLGEDKWIETVARVFIRHEDGTPAMFVFSFTVIDALATARQEMQEQIRRTSEELERAVHHNTVLNQIIKAGPWTFRFDRHKVLAESEFSPECLAVLQNDVTDGMQWLNMISPEDRDRVREAFTACISDPYCNTPFDAEYRVRSRNGEYHWIHSAGRMRWDEDGSGEFYGICVDIDETVQSREKEQNLLRDALSMAESANRSKTTFLNNMSHDIRTPMNAIIGFTGLASGHIDNKNQVRDYLGKIGEASDHLLSLINDVLDMSRIESGKMNLNETPENLKDIVSALGDIVQADIDAKEHEFTIDTEGVKDEVIVCDKLRLNQVLLNILSNSIKYTMPHGKIQLRISEKEIKPSGFASFEFVVKDNGIGMDEEYLKTIFDPFTRVKSSTVSGIQGTGLGMAITKNIVDMMGGRIDIQSEPGKGTETTVTIDFMIQGYDAEKLRETEDAGPTEPENYDFTGKKILLVEDNELNREIATEILEEEGFIIDTAEDGDIAVEKIGNAKEGDYDLVLMDIQMPRMDGYEATRQIRAMGTEISRIPILAMTANAFEEDRKAALDAGMNEHLAKPIEINKLKKTLAKFL